MFSNLQLQQSQLLISRPLINAHELNVGSLAHNHEALGEALAASCRKPCKPETKLLISNKLIARQAARDPEEVSHMFYMFIFYVSFSDN
jgi:hypothetical protein